MSSVAPAMMALRSGEGLDVFNDLLPAKLPTPDSWAKDEALGDAVQAARYSAAIGEARRQGKEMARSQVN